MYFKVCLIFIFLFVLSCSKIEFVYKNDIDTNKDIYNKTSVVISGIDIPSLYGHSLRYLGNDDKGLYLIKINIDEKKIKRSVQSNQAISKLDYKLFFKYELSNVEKQCVIYEKEIITRFTFEPQSSGYNFYLGSDTPNNITLGLYRYYTNSVASGQSPFEGNIAAFAIFNTELSASDASTIHNYYAGTYTG